MGGSSWPPEAQLNEVKEIVSEMSGRDREDVRVVASPYRICPLGAHIDHQGGTVSAMTINRGILLGFVPSGDNQVILRSGQFKGGVRFRIDEVSCIMNNGKDATKRDEESDWGSYARGAIYALQSRKACLVQGIIGYICGTKGMDSSGISSSAAYVNGTPANAVLDQHCRVVAKGRLTSALDLFHYCIGWRSLPNGLENANNLIVSPEENIKYDRLIENEFRGLRNGILDQSAILLSSYGSLLCMNCKTKEHKVIHPPKLGKSHKTEWQEAYKILLAFSGLKQALTENTGYNRRVRECQEAATVLLRASGNGAAEPVLSNVDHEAYHTHKQLLKSNLAKRAEHFFSENMRVIKGLEAWASGRLIDFGTLITESGLSSIQNYECGSEPLIQLREVILRAPGVYGARFSGAGFRGCCVALVDANLAAEAASFVREEYSKLQPDLASRLNQEHAVVICEAGDCARVI